MSHKLNDNSSYDSSSTVEIQKYLWQLIYLFDPSTNGMINLSILWVSFFPCHCCDYHGVCIVLWNFAILCETWAFVNFDIHGDPKTSLLLKRLEVFRESEVIHGVFTVLELAPLTHTVIQKSTVLILYLIRFYL